MAPRLNSRPIQIRRGTEMAQKIMAQNGVPDDIAAMSFEDALAELEQIVRGLASGERKPAEEIAAYERGASLKKHCETKQSVSQAKIDKISLDVAGNPAAKPATRTTAMEGQ